MSRQDRQGVRTAADLERKYDFAGQKELMKEIQKAISEVKMNISDMQDEDVSTGVISKTVSVFLEPGQEEWDIVSAHLSSEKPLSEKDVPFYDITGDGTIGMHDLLAIEKAINGDATLANWEKAKKSDVTITIDLSSPENLIKVTGTNMWGRDVEYNTGDFIQWVLKDIESNKIKIEKLKKDIQALTPEEDGNVSEEQITAIQNEISYIQKDLIDIKDDAYNLRESIGILANWTVESKYAVEEMQETVNALFGNFNEIYPIIYQNQSSIDYLMGTKTTEGIVTKIQSEITALEKDVDAINKYTRFVAHGTESSWNYEQLNTGRIRCWRKFSPGSKNFYTLANTFCYCTNTVAFPSNLFASAPTHVSITAFCSDDSMAFCSIASLGSGLVNWVTLLFNPNRDSGNFDVSYFIEVVGQGYLG